AAAGAATRPASSAAAPWRASSRPASAPLSPRRPGGIRAWRSWSLLGRSLAHRDRFFAHDRGPVVIDPRPDDGARLLGAKLELDIRVRRHRRLEIGGEQLFGRHHADELVED